MRKLQKINVEHQDNLLCIKARFAQGYADILFDSRGTLKEPIGEMLMSGPDEKRYLSCIEKGDIAVSVHWLKNNRFIEIYKVKGLDSDVESNHTVAFLELLAECVSEVWDCEEVANEYKEAVNYTVAKAVNGE